MINSALLKPLEQASSFDTPAIGSTDLEQIDLSSLIDDLDSADKIKDQNIHDRAEPKGILKKPGLGFKRLDDGEPVYDPQ